MTETDPLALRSPKGLSPFGGLKVLDLTAELGALACRILSGLGAEVTRIESPSGDALRRKPPLVASTDGKEFSLYWLHMMDGRTCTTQDLACADGAQRFLGLLENTDVVIESQPFGHLSFLGLDYDQLHGRFPNLIWTSITPFGRTGPRAGWAATDIIGMASGGLMSLCGDVDRAPLRVSVDQAYAQAGIVAVVGTLAAVHARTATGMGQLVDVSMQEAVSNCLGNARLYYEFDGIVSRRAGGARAYDQHGARLVYPCLDGFVAVSRNSETPGLLFQWMQEAGMSPGFDPVEWATFPQAGSGMPSPEKALELENELTVFFAAKPKMALYEEGQNRGIMICPVSTPADLLSNEQLLQREFFRVRRFADLGASFQAPGPPARMSVSSWDEHINDPAIPAANAGVQCPPHDGSNDSRAILAGLRVADFSWVGVGPLATQLLGQLGAEVIHVESSSRLDGLRSAGPRRGEGPDAGAYFANFNREKRGMTLNLHRPGAREIALRLARESDVLVESFRPGFMSSVGLSYDDIRAVNPNIICMSCSMEGATGPHSGFRGFGLTLQATVGFTHFTGWPDRPPVGTGTAYTDWFAANVAAAFLLSAIEHRRRTGQGQYVDLSQLEACIWALEAEVLRYTATGTFEQPRGNRHPEMAPHGAFPCKGGDEWLAISVRNDHDWKQLTNVVSDPRLARADFLTLRGRRAAEDEIEQLLASWTKEQDKQVAAELLQAHGIAAYPVNDMAGVHADPQLRARGHFWRQTHPVIGEVDWDAPAFRLSRTPLYPSRPAPLLGQDNAYVYGQVLGLDADRIADLTAAGVLE